MATCGRLRTPVHANSKQSHQITTEYSLFHKWLHLAKHVHRFDEVAMPLSANPPAGAA
jgi:hypothetical protein